MRVALAQIRSGTEPSANLDLVEDYTRRAADAGARLVLFPEATMCRLGVPLAADRRTAGRAVGDGSATDRRARRHRRRRRHVRPRRLSGGAGAGDQHPDRDGARSRRALRQDPPLRRLRVHRVEHRGAGPRARGDHGRRRLGTREVGLTLCYDVRFPELYVELARRGAQLITVHASWGTGAGKLEQWTLLARARAIDTTGFIAAVDQAYPGDEIAALGPTGVGGSVVASPMGEIVASAGDDPALARHRYRPRSSPESARNHRGNAQPHRSAMA